MADRTPDWDRDDDAERLERGPPTGTPRWVKVFGVVAIVVLVLFVVLLVFGGDHGPSRHSGDPGGQALPASFTVSADGSGDARPASVANGQRRS
jgi:hypothetical protein